MLTEMPGPSYSSDYEMPVKETGVPSSSDREMPVKETGVSTNKL